MSDGDVKVTISSAQALRERRAWQAGGYEGPCPVRELLDRVGDTWTVLVVLSLGEQPQRFRVLLRAVTGISQRMLTVTLRALERDGLVARRVFDTKPPAVEYRLTPLGHSLLQPISQLTQWALANQQLVLRARARFALK
jgi:DNA-binding HxlR family transcriptional regulator